MAVYKVGTLRQSSGLTDFLFQATDVSVVASKAEGKDENGNRKVTQHFNHVLRVRIEAVIPRDTAIPVPGEQVVLTGIVLPVIAADGSVSSGSLQVADLDGSGSGASATITGEVTGEPQVLMKNEELTRVQLDVEYGIINGVPGSGSGA